MSRTLALAKPRSCTTLRPFVRIFSRFDGLAMEQRWASVLKTQGPASRRRSWRCSGFTGNPNSSGQSVNGALSTLSEHGLRQRRAARQKLLQPMDMVIAIDDVGFAHQRAEQRQRRLDAVEDELVER